MHAYTDEYADSITLSDEAKTVRIEGVRAEHADSYHRIVDTLARSERYLGFDEPPPLDVASEIVNSHVRNNYPLYLAFVDDEPVGWCAIYQNTHKNFSHLGQLVIGVSSEYRGLGIGRALLSAAICKAKENGLKRIELEVCARNLPAIRLYRTFGFKKEGVKKRAYYVDGKFEHIMLMSIFTTE